eukprot:TRINITY_DN15991_c0_g2_i1.p1 TRINITY_DN15991_c0_g2~~TRINITY_DN15991_c0_g2_i1.p1  ORF type:complete len:1242 (+),score=250.62 TRINITY_DN15991_c0_g2_i1:77-3802(+)
MQGDKDVSLDVPGADFTAVARAASRRALATAGLYSHINSPPAAPSEAPGRQRSSFAVSVGRPALTLRDGSFGPRQVTELVAPSHSHGTTDALAVAPQLVTSEFQVAAPSGSPRSSPRHGVSPYSGRKLSAAPTRLSPIHRASIARGSVHSGIEGLTADELSMLNATADDLDFDLGAMGGVSRGGGFAETGMSPTTLRRRRQLSVTFDRDGGASEVGDLRELLADVRGAGPNALAGMRDHRSSLWEAMQDEDDILADPAGDLRRQLALMHDTLLENQELTDPQYEPPDVAIRGKFRTMLRNNLFYVQTVDKVIALAARLNRSFTVKTEVNKQVQDDLEAASAQATVLREELTATQETLAETRAEKAHQEEELRGELQKQAAKAAEERIYWEERMEALEAEMAMEREEMKRQALAMQEAAGGSVAQEKMIAVLKAEVADLNDTLGSRDQTILGLRAEAAKAQIEMEVLRGRAEKADGALPEAQARISALEGDLQEATAKLAEAERNAERQEAALQVKLAAAQAQVDRARLESKKAMTGEIHELWASIREKDDEIERLNAEVAAARGKMERELAALEEKHQGAAAGEAALRAQLVAKEGEVESMSTQIAELREAVDVVEKKLAGAKYVPVQMFDDETEPMEPWPEDVADGFHAVRRGLLGLGIGALCGMHAPLDAYRRTVGLAALRRFADAKKHARAISVRDEVIASQREQVAQLTGDLGDCRKQFAETRSKLQADIRELRKSMKEMVEEHERTLQGVQEETRFIRHEADRQCDEFRRAVITFGARLKRRLRMRCLKVTAMVDAAEANKNRAIPRYLMTLRMGVSILKSFSDMFIIEAKLVELRRKLIGTSVHRRIHMRRLERIAADEKTPEDTKSRVLHQRDAEQQHVHRIGILRKGVKDQEDGLFAQLEDGVLPTGVVDHVKERFWGMEALVRTELQVMNKERFDLGLDAARRRLIAISPEFTAHRQWTRIPSTATPQRTWLGPLDDCLDISAAPLSPKPVPERQHSARPESESPAGAPALVARSLGDSVAGPAVPVGVAAASHSSEAAAGAIAIGSAQQHGSSSPSGSGRRSVGGARGALPAFSESVLGSGMPCSESGLRLPLQPLVPDPEQPLYPGTLSVVAPIRSPVDEYEELPTPKPSGKLTDAERAAQGLRRGWTPHRAGGAGQRAEVAAAASDRSLGRPHVAVAAAVIRQNPAQRGGPPPGTSGTLVLLPRTSSKGRVRPLNAPPAAAITLTAAGS